MVKPGDIVFMGRKGGPYGRVQYQLEPLVNGKQLYHVHYVDPHTGRLKACPDPRCHGEYTCPIHGENRLASELRALSPDQLATFVKEGLLHSDLIPGE
jgi:hypothetical protein